MKDVIDRIEEFLDQNEKIAVATVVETWGSAPRPAGSKMITTRSGKIAGSVSAGCVEGAVIEESLKVIADGVPRLLRYGVSDDDAWGVGLACGGTIKVFIEPWAAWQADYPALRSLLADGEPVVVVGILDEDRSHSKLLIQKDRTLTGTFDLGGNREKALSFALERLAMEQGGILEIEDGPSLFFEVYPPPPQLIVIGAVQIAELLVTMGNKIGFETTVIDHRRSFATEERFPHAGKLIHAWPQEALPKLPLDSWAYVVILTHDPKVDEPALEIALQSGARYVGALGSKRTTRLRIERLKEMGVDDDQVARLHAPIGLPIGGRSPAEIAVSIMGEIIQTRSEEPS